MALTEAEELELLELEAAETEEPPQQTEQEQIMSEIRNEPGLQDVSLKTMVEAPFMAADIAGHEAAVYAAEKGVDPRLAALGGTAVQMIPHGLLAAKSIASGGVEKLANVVRKPISKLKAYAQSLKGPGVEEARAFGEKTLADFTVKPKRSALIEKLGQKKIDPMQDVQSTLRTKLKELPEEQVRFQAASEKASKLAGSNLGAIESKHGISFKEMGVPSVPENTAKFVSQMEAMAKQTPEAINSIMPLKAQQTLRKQAQMILKSNIPGELKSSISSGKKSIEQAMELTLGEEFANARQAVAKTEQSLEGVTAKFTTKRSKLGAETTRTANEIATQKTRIARLLKQSKLAEGKQLDKIESDLANIVYQATIREAKIRKLKSIGWATGAAAIGLGGPAAVISALK